MLRSIWDDVEDMNRRIDETFGVFPTMRVRRFLLPTLPGAVEKSFVPTTDVFAMGGDLVIDLDLPGIDPEKDLKITIEEGELVVTGERKKEKAYKEADYYRVERFFGTFEPHFPIPKTIDEKAVKATYKEGVLEIVLKGGARRRGYEAAGQGDSRRSQDARAGGESVEQSGPVASSAGAAGPFPAKILGVSVRPMAASLPATTALVPEDDAVLDDEPLDLGELAEASTSSGSYCLRWQLFESARRRNAVV